MNRDRFFRDMLRDITGTLEDVVGLNEAEGYISVVGSLMGQRIYAQFANEIDNGHIAPEDLPKVLVALKDQIGGKFRVVEQDAESITLINSACPFGNKVIDRRSLCMMTTNVFGYIAAEANGYAKVHLDKTIAAGDGFCRVKVSLKRNLEQGYEYYGAD